MSRSKYTINFLTSSPSHINLNENGQLIKSRKRTHYRLLKYTGRSTLNHRIINTLKSNKQLMQDLADAGIEIHKMILKMNMNV